MEDAPNLKQFHQMFLELLWICWDSKVVYILMQLLQIIACINSHLFKIITTQKLLHNQIHLIMIGF